MGRGGNAAAGAAGAFSGELATRYIAEHYFHADLSQPGNMLTEDERQQLSLLGTLAAGLAGGLTGNSIAAATTGAQAGKNAVENNSLSVLRQGAILAAEGCTNVASCRNALIEKGLGSLLGIGTAATILDKLSDTEKEYVLGVATTGRADLIEKLTPEQRAAYDYMVAQDQKGLITIFPAPDKPLTTGRLENPLPEISKETMLTTPDQRELNGATNTGNTSAQPDSGGNTTVTPVPEGPAKNDLAYLVEGRDNRLPIPEATVASNGLKVESNPKHTPGAPGSRPDAGIEPKNSLALFENSIATKDPKIRLSIDSDGNIHRFFNSSKDGSGTYHWSGSTGDSKNDLGNRELGSFNKEIKQLKGKR